MPLGLTKKNLRFVLTSSKPRPIFFHSVAIAKGWVEIKSRHWSRLLLGFKRGKISEFQKQNFKSENCHFLVCSNMPILLYWWIQCQREQKLIDFNNSLLFSIGTKWPSSQTWQSLNPFCCLHSRLHSRLHHMCIYSAGSISLFKNKLYLKLNFPGLLSHFQVHKYWDNLNM